MAQQTSQMQKRFSAFVRPVMADGALPAKVKELIAFAVAHANHVQFCKDGHAKRAIDLGATQDELIEAMWVASMMSAAGTLAGEGMRAEAAIQQAIAGLRAVHSRRHKPRITPATGAMSRRKTK